MRPAVFVPALAAVLLAAGGSLCQAQIQFSATVDRTRYLPYESIQLTLKIRNDTGSAMIFDFRRTDQGRIEFRCQGGKMDLRESVSLAPVLGDELRLTAGQQREVTVAVNRLLPMHRTGWYDFDVLIAHPLLASNFRSQPGRFEVREPDLLWSKVAGIPQLLPDDDAGGPAPTRRFSLLRFADVDSDILCLKIEDARRIYAIERLARQMSSEVPPCDLDGRSNLHLLLRLDANVFSYLVYDWRGRLLQNRLYAVAKDGPPVLTRDPEHGLISVQGGRLARRGTDYQIEGREDEEDLTPETPDEAPPEAPAEANPSPAQP